MDNARELIDAIAAAVPLALAELAGVNVIVRDSRPAGEDYRSAELCAVITLTTTVGEAKLLLGFPHATAAMLAERIFAETHSAVPAEMIGDCMGEVVNVVAGQAKALLIGSPAHFTLSTPTVQSGLHTQTAGRWVIRFDSDVGSFDACIDPPI